MHSSLARPLIALSMLVLILAGCTTTHGAKGIADDDVDKVVTGMTQEKVRSILRAPTETYDDVDHLRAEQIVGKLFADEAIRYPEGRYDVWYYKARTRTHHYFVFFFYNTYVAHQCYLVFNRPGRLADKRCRHEEE